MSNYSRTLSVLTGGDLYWKKLFILARSILRALNNVHKSNQRPGTIVWSYEISKNIFYPTSVRNDGSRVRKDGFAFSVIIVERSYGYGGISIVVFRSIRMRGVSVEPIGADGWEGKGEEKKNSIIWNLNEISGNKPDAGIAVPLIVGRKRPGFRNETVRVTGDVRWGKKQYWTCDGPKGLGVRRRIPKRRKKIYWKRLKDPIHRRPFSRVSCRKSRSFFFFYICLYRRFTGGVFVQWILANI